MDTRELAGDPLESSEDEASPEDNLSTPEFPRTPLERHAFLFRRNLSPSDPNLRDLHPLPSQIPFLLDMFSENVNVLVRIVHMPSITKSVRERRDGHTILSHSNEALMFSIYYATIISMEEDEVSSPIGMLQLKHSG